MNVAAADTAGANADEDFFGTNLGNRHIGQFEMHIFL
jgi:hypothetical protein